MSLTHKTKVPLALKYQQNNRASYGDTGGPQGVSSITFFHCHYVMVIFSLLRVEDLKLVKRTEHYNA